MRDVRAYPRRAINLLVMGCFSLSRAWFFFIKSSLKPNAGTPQGEKMKACLPSAQGRRQFVSKFEQGLMVFGAVYPRAEAHQIYAG